MLLILVSLFLGALLHPARELRGAPRDALGERQPRSSSSSRRSSRLRSATCSLHPVYASATNFAAELPNLVRQAQHGKGQIGHLVHAAAPRELCEERTRRSSRHSISGLGRPALAIGKTVVSGVVALATVVVLTFFILLEAPRLIRGVLDWMRPERSVRAAHHAR